MSITDELRKWGRATLADTSLLVRMEAISDRIDAEHQKALDERKAKHGDMWLKGYEVCREELMEGHPIIAASLEEAGWIRLPKDADNVPWNVGDRDEDGNEVIALKLASDGWFVITDGEWLHRPDPYRPERKRHHHAPTVEDVLREFALKAAGKECMTMRSDLLDEYASKLQLREDA